ncbi:LD-carboxypeptidase [Paenibacillus camerounensis]|uniref:LD-carboxypeptidase n=1 Tax=Paenibacillus camerounensis TaxID=1243663 RepID=UPI003137912A
MRPSTNNDKARSAPGREWGTECNQMMQDEDIDLIIPPWGGELLIEMLEFIDFDRIRPKWVMGFSDISLLLLAITLRTGRYCSDGAGGTSRCSAILQKTYTVIWQKSCSSRSFMTLITGMFRRK